MSLATAIAKPTGEDATYRRYFDACGLEETMELNVYSHGRNKPAPIGSCIACRFSYSRR